MEDEERGGKTAQKRRPIDWQDLEFVLLLGIVSVALKLAVPAFPAWQFSRTTLDVAASTLCAGYILARARREPEKLDEWGLTTPVTFSAWLTAAALLGVSVALLAAGGILAAGSLSFQAAYIPQMIEYVLAAFPQQFVLCSIGLTTLAAWGPFQRTWRLPLIVGLAFSLAHFWTPARIPGTIVPIQMLITFPAGFFAAFYFLKFRNILPLTAIHAIVYPLLHHWIETHL